MRVLYIWDADYPWDVRVEKICRTLAESGHDVHIAARNLKRLPEKEEASGIVIHRLKPRMNSTMNRVISFPAFFNPIWGRFVASVIECHDIELIIVRDLPLSITGLWAGKHRQIPIIFDMAEDYTAMIRDIWRKSKFKGLNILLRNPFFAKLVERYALKRFDHIIVVTEEATDVVIRGGGNPDRVTVVGNTPWLKMVEREDSQALNAKIAIIKSRFSAIYIGGIQMGRGLQTVLDAIPEIIRSVLNFLFVVVGDGYASKHIQDLVRIRRLNDHVLWVGWVEHEEILPYITASKVGLIPHFVTAHTNSTIPNKLYDYMACGIPVIASDAVPLRRILEGECCGITFRSGDPRELARAVIEIYESIERGDNKYGKNGIEAVQRKYNWRYDSERLIGIIENFEMRGRAASSGKT